MLSSGMRRPHAQGAGRPAARHFVVAAAVLGLALALLPGPAVAQSKVAGGIGFLAGIPQGDFSDNLDENGFGLSGHVGYLVPGVPLMIGGELGFLIYGHESRREPFSTTIPDVTVEVTTDNSIVLGHALLRLQPRTGALRPYIEGLVGLHYLYTSTSIKNESGGEEVASSTNQDDVAFSAGGGAGLLIRVHERAQEEGSSGSSLDAVFIDLRGRYLYGAEAEYLKKGSIRRQDGRVTFDTLESRTDLMTIALGVALHF